MKTGKTQGEIGDNREVWKGAEKVESEKQIEEMVQKEMERHGKQINRNWVNRSGNGWKGAERS